MVEKVVDCSHCPFSDFCKVRRSNVIEKSWWNREADVLVDECPLAKLVINEIL